MSKVRATGAQRRRCRILQPDFLKRMVRTASLLFAGSLLLFAACKEKDSTVYFGSVTKSTDTTYVGTVEPGTSRRVLIEEFTGVKCPNCPAGHNVISGFLSQYPDRLSVIGYQIYGNDQTRPVEGETRNDNRSQKATDLSNQIFGGVPFLPVAGFDRTLAAGALLNNRTLWASSLSSRLSLAAPVNLTVTPSYNADTRQLTVKVRVAYTADVPGKQRMTLALTESKIVDAQESTDTVYADYDHEHVFRDFLTASDGDAFLDALTTKTAGRVYERQFTYLVSDKWNAANCSLVAIVQSAEGTSKDVYQTAEAKLR